MPMPLLGLLDRVDRLAQRHAGRQIEARCVTAGNWPWWLIDEWRVVGSKCATADSGTMRAASADAT